MPALEVVVSMGFLPVQGEHHGHGQGKEDECGQGEPEGHGSILVGGGALA